MLGRGRHAGRERVESNDVAAGGPLSPLTGLRTPSAARVPAVSWKEIVRIPSSLGVGSSHNQKTIKLKFPIMFDFF